MDCGSVVGRFPFITQVMEKLFNSKSKAQALKPSFFFKSSTYLNKLKFMFVLLLHFTEAFQLKHENTIKQ